ncbi:FliA/WhiG family RNA polymerase sigma factor [Thiomonas intermedia]|uniref:FliA/WhiG family RNA polymerase sigma factor n=1 Tax=Thiomonas intermedia TaxID=926 RepID=UPI0009A4FD14|nr:FliA/WhiG family RNA polymerase sigma factor [Thiomonas intermedia]
MKPGLYPAPETREERLAKHLPMVRRIAGQMAAQLPASVDFSDLEQAGMIGLWDALDRGEMQSPAQFATYAAIRIRGAIYDELRKLDWLPRRSRAKERQIERTEALLTQRLGRHPIDAEIAAHLGWELAEYYDALAETSMQLVYLEDLTHDDGSSVADRKADEASLLPEDLLQDAELERDLQAAIRDLPEREKLVLSLYYQEDLQLKDIGRVLEVSESRVSQLMKQAVMRLRARLQAHQAPAGGASRRAAR